MIQNRFSNELLILWCYLEEELLELRPSFLKIFKAKRLIRDCDNEWEWEWMYGQSKLNNCMIHISRKRHHNQSFPGKPLRISLETVNKITDKLVAETTQALLAFEGNMSFTQAEHINDNILRIEDKIKEDIKQGIQIGYLEEEDYHDYLSKRRNYFSVKSFNNINFEILFENLEKYEKALDLKNVALKKDFLQYQCQLASID